MDIDDIPLEELLAAAKPEVLEHELTNAFEPPPCPTTLIDPEATNEANVATLVAADALLNATSLAMLTQKMISLAYESDDLDLVRKTVATVRDGALLYEKRKTPVTSQVPLTIVFERANMEGVRVDVRSGAEMAAKRRAAAQALTVDARPATVTPQLPPAFEREPQVTLAAPSDE